MIEDLRWLLSVSPLVSQVVVAMVVGGLIGIEREKRGQKFAGLRTLTILCGTGAAVVYYANAVGTPAVVVLYLALTAVIALYIAHVRFQIQGRDVGFTTTVTVFFVGILGVLVGYGHFVSAMALSLITTFLLAEKRQLHGYVDKLTYEELTDALKLGALVVILYPIIPTEPIGPFQAIDLREVRRACRIVSTTLLADQRFWRIDRNSLEDEAGTVRCVNHYPATPEYDHRGLEITGNRDNRTV